MCADGFRRDAMFRIHSDYRLERLGECLAEDLSRSRDDPFEPDFVVCQSQMARSYLDKLVADRCGVSANVRYFYPRSAVFELLAAGGVPGVTFRFAAETMLWRVYREIPRLEGKYGEIKEYIDLHEASRDRRGYMFAKEVARVFDYYVGYRGDWLEAWSLGRQAVSPRASESAPPGFDRHVEWQADLWRSITKSVGNGFKRVPTLLRGHLDEVAGNAPGKISIFGLSNLPPDYLEFFAILADAGVDIDFYYLAPCVEYWADTTRRAAALEGVGNPLLAAFGALGRDFFSRLLDGFENGMSGGAAEFPEFDGEPKTVLEALRSDILRNVPAEESALKGVSRDRSVTVASCYGRMREVEALKNHVLKLMRDGDMNPGDILVVAPDISIYAPYIQVVFERSEPTIPFAVSRASLLGVSSAADAFVRILDFPGSAATAEEVFEILSSDMVAKRFALSPAEIPIARKLILSANITWGRDGGHRKEKLGFDYCDQGSWEFGLKRIIAGYAFDTDGVADDGVAPLAVSAEEAVVAGKLAEFRSRLFKTADALSKPRPAKEWRVALLAVLADFERAPNEPGDEVDAVAAAIDALADDWADADMEDEPLSLPVVAAAVRDVLGPDSRRPASVRGCLTFCDLAVARGIPYDAICVLGLNDGAFPRRDSSSGFDLSRADPRAGDRSPREEDSYLLLEAILACRGSFYMSYMGRDPSDNSEIPPSVAVEELLAYIESAMGIPSKEFVVEHPLHGFDVRYFVPGSPISSFSKSDFEAAKANAEGRRDASGRLFCPNALAFDTDVLEFRFDDFVRFFQAPPRFFLRRRLGITLRFDDEDPLPVSEAFATDNLKSYNLKDEALERVSRDGGLEPFELRKKGEGVLPPGAWGEYDLKQTKKNVLALTRALEGFGDKRPPIVGETIEFDVGDVKLRLSGAFENIRGGGMVLARVGKVRDKHKLAAWIWHLLAEKASPEGWNGETFQIGLDKGVAKIFRVSKPSLLEDDDAEEDGGELAEETLSYLATLFVQGLSEPLPLFEHGSFEYARKFKRNPDRDAASRAAALRWIVGDANYGGGDLADDANRVCFGDSPPQLDDRLSGMCSDLAETVYMDALEWVSEHKPKT